MKLSLVTVSIIPSGCYGVLLKPDGTPFILTLERTMDDGWPIIPRGTFKCVKTTYFKGNYATFEITGISGHSRLLFHKANVEDQLAGCIATGTSFDEIGGKSGVAASGAAFAEFMALVGGETSFDLEVTGR